MTIDTIKGACIDITYTPPEPETNTPEWLELNHVWLDGVDLLPLLSDAVVDLIIAEIEDERSYQRMCNND